MGWKGGYGNLKVAPKPMGPSSAQIIPFPRRMGTIKGKSPVPQIAKSFYRLKTPRLGPRTGALVLPILGPLIRRMVRRAQEDPLPIFEAEQFMHNANWERVCTGTPNPSDGCWGWPIAGGRLSSNATFCGLTTAPSLWAPGQLRVNLWFNKERCDSGAMWWARKWRRPVATNYHLIMDRPAYWAPFQPGMRPVPELLPELAPDGLPVGSPAPHPQIYPMRYRAAVRRAQDRLNPGSASGPRPAPRPRPAPGVRPLPPHQPVPPGRGVKEQKKYMPKWLVNGMRAALAGTEFKDLVEAIAEGMGWDQSKGPMVPYIYRNWDKITDAQFQQIITNLVYNYIEDGVIGRLSGGRFVISNSDGTKTVFRRMGDGWITARF